MENSYVLRIRENNTINFKFCGYSECEPLHSFGPASRPVYIIHVILEGKGVYTVDNKQYFLEKGQGFLIEPNVVTFYQANSETPWRYCWVAFDGEDVKKYLKKSGLTDKNPIFKIDKLDELHSLIKNMLSNREGDIVDELKLQSLFYQFFSIIVDNCKVEVFNDLTPNNIYINKILEYISDNYWKGINVNSIVDYVGLNRSYVSTMFQKQMGITLKNYLTIFRLSRANELLDITDDTVEEIANHCGYDDPLIFSKAYKKRYGMTPTQHRKLDREKASKDLHRFKEEFSTI